MLRQNKKDMLEGIDEEMFPENEEKMNLQIKEELDEVRGIVNSILGKGNASCGLAGQMMKMY